MKRYVIIDTNELDNLDFSGLLTTSILTARQNLAGDKAIVSYEGTIPSALSGKTKYTNEELLAIINNIDNNWYEGDPED